MELEKAHATPHMSVEGQLLKKTWRPIAVESPSNGDSAADLESCQVELRLQTVTDICSAFTPSSTVESPTVYYHETENKNVFSTVLAVFLGIGRDKNIVFFDYKWS